MGVRWLVPSLLAVFVGFGCTAFGSAPAVGEGGDASAPDAASKPGVCDGGACADRLIFVTKMVFDGNLGGLDGADAKCTAAASAAGRLAPHRAFKAWLSMTREGQAVNAYDRIGGGAGLRYLRTDGMLVAATFADLRKGPKVPIDHDENNGVGEGLEVWTGTDEMGLAVGKGDECSEWASAQSAEAFGLVGLTNQINKSWTSYQPRDCALSARLYCIEVEE